MTDFENADELFAEYVVAHQSGEVDPVPFLERTGGNDEVILINLIDAYLVASPGREWDPEAFRDSPAERLVDPITRTLTGVSGTWPVLLPSLRNRARIQREEVVARLAEGLGFAKNRKTVDGYYHDMEFGNLPSSGVTPKVLDVLSNILGTSSESLRRAGEVIGGGKFEVENAIFTRRPTVIADAEMSSPKAEGQASPARTPEPDPVDLELERLFTGGRD